MTREEALKILELSEGYTEEDLKKNHRRLIMRYHPDKTGGKTTDLFLSVQKSYEYLINFRKVSRKIILTHSSIFNIIKLN